MGLLRIPMGYVPNTKGHGVFSNEESLQVKKKDSSFRKYVSPLCYILQKKKVAMMTVVITTANLQSFDCHLVSPLKI